MRRILTLWLLSVLTLLAAGCASTRTYTEDVSTLMVSSDSKTFAVLGPRYHYLFDMPAPMAQALSSDFRSRLTAVVLRDFNVGADGYTWGLVRLQLSPDATARDRAQALAMHFQTTKDGLVYYTHHLKGKRYVARPGTPSAAQAGAATSTTLDQTYRVTVQDSQASADAMKLLSPVAFVAGTGFVVANPAVVLFALPVAGLEP
ncbi:hypothetical protein AKG08_14110 [Achromobacter piechaudii]|uniref:hypothetical protein n=1 Tax=Achromobacter piechaudii TaxID=72556 RepID=UPI000680A18E|nr:hypothetical protein [Achromobacter piechaudii]KNY09581.1 hypothetical protein AKG08_14110 [Achromobacter piechaudii]